MTTKQRRWYLREWNAAWRAHWGCVRKGEPVTNPRRPQHHPLRDQVIGTAQRMALRRPDCRLTADLLRRACHVVAIGRDCSSYELKNKQLDQVVAVFRVLAGINDLAGQMRLEARDRETVRRSSAKDAFEPGCGADAPWVAARPDADPTRLKWRIEHLDYPPAAVGQICEDTYGTKNWRSLPEKEMHQLLITLLARSAARQVANAIKGRTLMPVHQ